MPTGHLYVFFGEMSVEFCPFFDWFAIFIVELYILEIKPLSGASFANIFSRSIGCVFFFFYGFLCCAKAWGLGPMCLFLFLFLLPWEADLRKYWHILCQGMFCLCFFSKEFYGVMCYV